MPRQRRIGICNSRVNAVAVLTAKPAFKPLNAAVTLPADDDEHA